MCDEESDMSRQAQMMAIYDLVDAVQKRGLEYQQLMSQCFALVNVFTNHKYNLIIQFLSAEKRQVLSTNAACLLSPGTSSEQVKLAWRRYTDNIDSTDKPAIHDMDNSVDRQNLMKWTSCPTLEKATIKLHLLYVKMSKTILTSITDTSSANIPQAKAVVEFLEAIYPHWVSSLAVKSFTKHGYVVLASMNMHKLCQNSDTSSIDKCSVAALGDVSNRCVGLNDTAFCLT